MTNSPEPKGKDSTVDLNATEPQIAARIGYECDRGSKRRPDSNHRE